MKFKTEKGSVPKFVCTLFISIAIFSCSNEETETVEATELGTTLNTTELEVTELETISQVVATDNAYYRIQGVASRKKISVEGGSDDAGSNVIIRENDGGEDQIWYFDEVGSTDGWYQIKRYSGSTFGSSYDVYLTAGTSGNGKGTTVTVEERDASDYHQQWRIAQYSDGSYAIINREYDSSRLDVQNLATGNGGNIHLWTNTWGTNQKWSFTKVENSNLP